MTGSNRRPPACKAGALPAELIPQSLLLTSFELFPFASENQAMLGVVCRRVRFSTQDTLRQRSAPIVTQQMVGQIGIEPMTPALSRRCSNRLSY